jgi:hypothetical protein
MSYLESLQYLETNLSKLVEHNGRISKLPKLEGKDYVSERDMQIILQSLTSSSKKPVNKSRIKSIAFFVRSSLDKNFNPLN